MDEVNAAVCECGCGGTPNPGRRFISGHNLRAAWHPRKHGMEGTKTYRVWVSMKNRCLCPTNHAYAKYGGRGITVCERWREFEGFFADMGVKPDGLSLDRTDNDGGYWCGHCDECVRLGHPANCKWATSAEQMRNRGCVKLNPELVALIRSSPLASPALGAQLGIDPGTVRKVRRGERWAGV